MRKLQFTENFAACINAGIYLSTMKRVYNWSPGTHGPCVCYMMLIPICKH